MKRIIVIGATSGIGRKLAELFAKEGHMVGITGRRQELLEQVRQFYPTNVVTACFDAASTNSREHLESLISEIGGMDIFIYNAGFGEPSPDLVEATEIETTRTNVLGFVTLTSFAFNFFCRQGQGQIAVTSSIAALRGNSWTPAYSASKAFLSNYAEGLSMKALRLKQNIFITDIKPGFVKTKMAKGHGQFWVAGVDKAALQIKRAIEKKKRRVYITRRWRIIAWILKILPFSVYRRIA
jgi:short-subunit dehydrogenase